MLQQNHIVMLMSMVAWALRFGFFGIGNPGSGVWLFILSMIVYGIAFDFFNMLQQNHRLFLLG